MLLVLAVLLINHQTTFHYSLLIITLFDHSDLYWLNHHLIDKVYGNANVSCQFKLHTWHLVFCCHRLKGKWPWRQSASALAVMYHCDLAIGVPQLESNNDRRNYKLWKKAVRHSKIDSNVIISYMKTASAAETSSGNQGKKIYEDFQEWLVECFLVILLIILYYF